MKRKILTAAMIAPMLAAPASGANHECYVPMKNWHSRREVVEFIEAQGWLVHKVRIDDGCYEIYGLNAEGIDIEMRINPGSLEILSLEVERFGQREIESPID